LDFLVGLTKSSHPGVSARAKEVLDRAGKLRIVGVCSDCGKRAKFISVKWGNDGVAFDGLRCEGCQRSNHPGYSSFPLSIYSLRYFSRGTDKRQFMSELRQACGLPAFGWVDPYQALRALGVPILL